VSVLPDRRARGRRNLGSKSGHLSETTRRGVGPKKKRGEQHGGGERQTVFLGFGGPAEILSALKRKIKTQNAKVKTKRGDQVKHRGEAEKDHLSY